MLIVAGFSRHREVLAWAQTRMEEAFGPLAREGPTIDFVQTQYYERTMGPDLKKKFLAFERLAEHDQLAAVKRTTIELEAEIIGSRRWPAARHSVLLRPRT